MPENRKKLFNYRPLVILAGGMCIGLIFSALLASPLLTAIATAILACGAMALYKFGYKKYAFITAAVLYGLLVTLLSAIFAKLPAAHYIPNKLDEIRYEIKTVINSLFGETSGMVTAMLLGDRESIDYMTKSAYQISGIAHILALSGLHISIFSGALLCLLPSNKPLLREIIVGAFLLIYCALTGFSPSLVRASVMTLCLLSAPIFNRRNDSLSSISAAAVIILTFSPSAIENIGFQLSFAAVIGITLLYAPIKQKTDFFGSAISSTIAVSVSATLGTMPLMLYHFSRLSVYALLANIIILPMVSIALITALIAVILYAVSPAAATVLAFVPRVFFSAITYFAKAIASLPLSELSLPRSSIVFTILCYVSMAAFSPYCFASKRNRLMFGSGSLIIGLTALMFAQII